MPQIRSRSRQSGPGLAHKAFVNLNVPVRRSNAAPRLCAIRLAIIAFAIGAPSSITRCRADTMLPFAITTVCPTQGDGDLPPDEIDQRGEYHHVLMGLVHCMCLPFPRSPSTTNWYYVKQGSVGGRSKFRLAGRTFTAADSTTKVRSPPLPGRRVSSSSLTSLGLPSTAARFIRRWLIFAPSLQYDPRDYA